MSSARLETTDEVTQDTLTARDVAVREAVASARIEGGDVGPEAKAIMDEWAAGLIDKETMVQRVLRLHEPI